MSFIRHASQTVFVRLMLIVVGIAGGIVQARWLGPEGVGAVVLLVVAKSFAFRFGNLGFGSAIAYYVARGEVSVRRAVRIMWLIGGVISALCIVAMLSVWRLKFSPWRDIEPFHFYLYVPAIPLAFLSNYLRRVLSGALKITATNIGDALADISRIVFLVVFVVVLRMGLVGAILSEVFADLSVCLYYQIALARAPKQVEVADKAYNRAEFFKKLWQYGRWNYLLMFSNFLGAEAPVILLKSLVADNAVVGIFSKAASLARRSRVATDPVAGVLFPYTAASRPKDAVRRTNVLCRNYTLVMAVPALIAAFLAKPLIVLMYGEAFLPAAKVFCYIVPSIIFWPAGHFLGVHIAASGKAKLAFLVSLVDVAFAVVLCLLLIPKYGAVGAALGLGLRHAARALFLAAVYSKLTGAHVVDVLLPKRSDWDYYRRAARGASSWIGSRMKLAGSASA